MVAPISAGLAEMVAPAASSAAILSCARPELPVMIALVSVAFGCGDGTLPPWRRKEECRLANPMVDHLGGSQGDSSYLRVAPV